MQQSDISVVSYIYVWLYVIFLVVLNSLDLYLKMCYINYATQFEYKSEWYCQLVPLIYPICGIV